MPPKVIHIITRMDMGGSAQNTLLTCLGLAGRYTIMLVYGIALESGMTSAEQRRVENRLALAAQKGVTCVPLPSLVRRIHPFQDLITFVRLFRLLHREKPAMVHTHSSKAGVLGRWAAWLARVPVIVHTPHGHVFWGHFGALASKLFFIVEKISALITDQTIALTAGEKKDYVRLGIPKAGQMVTIHSGVDVEPYMQAEVNIAEKKAALGLDPAGLVVGTVGWLLPIKGPLHLFDAMVRIWQKRSDVSLVYVGQGDLEKTLKDKALALGLQERVKFLGWRDDVETIMPVFDLLVLPSLNEGMGRVLVEAMAAARPVVASNVGGIPDLVEHGGNGLLVAPGNVFELTAAIEKLLNDSCLRQQMGQRGQLRAHNYDVDAMVAKIEHLYAAML